MLGELAAVHYTSSSVGKTPQRRGHAAASWVERAITEVKTCRRLFRCTPTFEGSRTWGLK